MLQHERLKITNGVRMQIKKELLSLYFIITFCGLLFMYLFTEKVIARSSTDDYLSQCSTYQYFNNVNELKKASGFSSRLVATRGYFNIDDNGGAYYRIVESTDKTIDGIFVLKLDCGKYAELQYDSKTILNVACAGVFPNESISEKLNRLIYSATNKIYGIQFNDGTYTLDKPVYLDSLNFYGTGNTELSVSSLFHTNDDKVMLTEQYTDKTFKLSFKNIDFSFETCSNHTLQGREIVFLALHNISSCVIDNCNIVARPSDENGAYMPVDLLWFRFSEAHRNITITNSRFINMTGILYPASNDVTLTGGCLWFTGHSEQSKISNINISNCYFETTVNDEAVAIWSGKCSDISIKNSTIKTYSHNNNNMVTLNDGRFNNVLFDNVNFEAAVPTCYMFKASKLMDNSSVSFRRCHFKASSTKSDNNFSVLEISDSVSANKIIIDHCNVCLDNQTSYRGVITSISSEDTDICMTNCKVVGQYTYGIVVFDNTRNVSFSCKSNILKTSGHLMELKNSHLSNFEISNNDIYCSISAVIDNSGSFNYVLSNNTINQPGIVICLNQVNSVDSKSHLTIVSNSISDGEQIIPFFSNSNISQNDFMYVTP